MTPLIHRQKKGLTVPSTAPYGDDAALPAPGAAARLLCQAASTYQLYGDRHEEGRTLRKLELSRRLAEIPFESLARAAERGSVPPIAPVPHLTLVPADEIDAVPAPRALEIAFNQLRPHAPS